MTGMREFWDEPTPQPISTTTHRAATSPPVARIRRVRNLASGLLRVSRRLQLSVWATRARTRMKWVGIRFQASFGDGVVFVRNPFVLAGVRPPGESGSLTVRFGNRVRVAPGVIIE